MKQRITLLLTYNHKVVVLYFAKSLVWGSCPFVKINFLFCEFRRTLSQFWWFFIFVNLNFFHRHSTMIFLSKKNKVKGSWLMKVSFGKARLEVSNWGYDFFKKTGAFSESFFRLFKNGFKQLKWELNVIVSIFGRFG